jgi:hypothetical protein
MYVRMAGIVRTRVAWLTTWHYCSLARADILRYLGLVWHCSVNGLTASRPHFWGASAWACYPCRYGPSSPSPYQYRQEIALLLEIGGAYATVTELVLSVSLRAAKLQRRTFPRLFELFEAKVRLNGRAPTIHMVVQVCDCLSGTWSQRSRGESKLVGMSTLIIKCKESFDSPSTRSTRGPALMYSCHARIPLNVLSLLARHYALLHAVDIENAL